MFWCAILPICRRVDIVDVVSNQQQYPVAATVFYLTTVTR